MKKILKMLVLGLLSAALLCCALPSAFAAEDKDSQVYTIGLDAMGGSSSAVAVTTNLSGKLSALPAQPTLEGYTFDGWYTEPVGGTKISTSTVFTGDTTVYAHWTVKNATTSTSTSTPAQPEQTAQEYDDGPILSVLAVAGALITTLAVAAFIEVFPHTVSILSIERKISMSTMKLPANYASISEEEMVYLDGGASNAYNSFLNVGKVFNAIARIFSGASSIINNVNVIYQSFLTLGDLLKSF